MPKRVSAGILMYRGGFEDCEVLIAHPGGPFFFSKNDGSWTIPKGEVLAEEEFEHAARREFREEIGIEAPGPFLSLGSIRQKSGKIVHAWASYVSPDWQDGQEITSVPFTLEWPPHSGKEASFPEIDRAQFFPIGAARAKIMAEQAPLLDRLLAKLGNHSAGF